MNALCEVFPLCQGHLSIFLMHLQLFYFYLLRTMAKSVQQKGARDSNTQT